MKYGSEGGDESGERIGLVMRIFPWVTVGGFFALIATAILLIPEASAPRTRAPLEAETIAGRTAPEGPAMTGRTAANPLATDSKLAAAGKSASPTKITEVKPDLRSVHEGGAAGLMAYNAKFDTGSFCDESKWKRMGDLVKRVSDYQVYVARDDWESKTTGTQVQLASWMSKCKLGGQPVGVRAESDGALLASYSTEGGFVPAARGDGVPRPPGRRPPAEEQAQAPVPTFDRESLADVDPTSPEALEAVKAYAEQFIAEKMRQQSAGAQGR